MVADEYSVDGAPGSWHIGIAVTQDRVFLCGETIAGRMMTRTVMDIYDRQQILAAGWTSRCIRMKTTGSEVKIKGENLESLAEQFRNAALPENR